MSQTEGFPLISGRISLDIVNTEVVRRGVRHDLLVSENDLQAWLHAMQQGEALHPSQIPSFVASDWPEALQAVRNIRQFLREHFEQFADGKSLTAEWTESLENMVSKAPFSYRLIEGKLVSIPLGKASDRLVSLIAYDALQLQAEEELGALKRCANEDCVLLFTDQSGRRKWCSMQICGNRNKVARFQNKKGQRD